MGARCRRARRTVELVELGSGSAVKTRLLIDAILERSRG